MEKMTINELGLRYRVEASSLVLGNILNQIYQGQPLSPAFLKVLQSKGLYHLHQHATGETTFEGYIAALDAEEAERLARIKAAQEAEDARLAQLAEARRRREEAAEAERIARESDPAYIEMKRREALFQKYGISSPSAPSDHLVAILEKLDAYVALDSDQYLWLTTTGKRNFTPQVRSAYHRGQAISCVAEFHSKGDPWSVVNGSGHFRKCGQADKALELLDLLDADKISNPKTKSALHTTRGGVMRDLGRHKEAVKLGDQAHKLTPRDFRPCTLLGAVHMELGNFNLAHDWYDMAIERGATEESIDSELKRIFAQADKAKRESLKAYLLAEDPARFSWVNKPVRP
ncbi:hypothetical protein ACFPU0_02905 [Pseudomonas sp. GCM10022186]|uniref:hypothetical protein n=1 Tax=Pseudomonas sp. GCM10022186 TaxID=3252650 RepID=UPI00361DBDBA